MRCCECGASVYPEANIGSNLQKYNFIAIAHLNMSGGSTSERTAITLGKVFMCLKCFVENAPDELVDKLFARIKG